MSKSHKTKLPIPISKRKQIVLKVRSGTPKSRVDQLLKDAALSNFAVNWVEPHYLRPRAGSTSDLQAKIQIPPQPFEFSDNDKLVSSNSLTSILNIDERIDNSSLSNEELRVESPPPEQTILQPLSPELNNKIKKMNDSSKFNQSHGSSSFIKLHPGTFGGELHQDVNDFIYRYERACRVNNWLTDEEQAQYLPIFLTGAASIWLENYEVKSNADSKLFSKVKIAMIKSFQKCSQKAQAEYMLRTRRQGDTEAIDLYYNDMLKICRLVDNSMEETDISRHILNGIKRDMIKDLVLMTGNDEPNKVLENYKKIEHARNLAKEVDPNSELHRQTANDISKLSEQMDQLSTQIRYNNVQQPRRYTNYLNNNTQDYSVARSNYDARNQFNNTRGFYNNARGGYNNARGSYNNTRSYNNDARGRGNNYSRENGNVTRSFNNDAQHFANNADTYRSTPQRPSINAQRYDTNTSSPNATRSPYYRDLFNSDPYHREQRTQNGRPICRGCNRPGHLVRDCHNRPSGNGQNSPRYARDNPQASSSNQRGFSRAYQQNGSDNQKKN